MKSMVALSAMTLSMWMASTSHAQVVRGVMTVTGAEMH